MSDTTQHYNLLRMTLCFAVYIRILGIQKRGGITDEDIKRISDFGEVLAFRGDVLLFGSKKKDEVADMFNRLADAIAVMSFFPGGITIFGDTYKSEMDVELNTDSKTQTMSNAKRTIMEILKKRGML